MINYIIKLIVKKELNKIEASSEALFYNVLCNKYNDGNEFKEVGSYCCETARKLRHVLREPR